MNSVPKQCFPTRPKMIFMGTPDFAVPTLRSLIDSGHQILAVISQPDRPKGRGRKVELAPVKKLAQALRIEVLQPEKASDDGFCDIIRRKDPDLIIVVAFGQILKKNLLAIPRWGAINIHASLLPRLRGAAPIPWAILDDETKTGLTIMRMDEGLDTGPILFQKEIPILEGETAGQLHDRLASMAGEFMIKALKLMAESPPIETPQDHGSATYAPKIGRDASFINWTQSARQVAARMRGLDPKPGAHTHFHSEQLKLFNPTVMDEEDGIPLVPGRVAGCQGGRLIVETGLGRIGISELQYPGRRRLSASDFLRGFPIPEGTVLGK